MQVCRLDALCDIRSGGTPPRGNPENYGGSIPWVKISDIESANGSLSVTEETITDKGLESIRGRIFPAGTLLFAIYGSVGKSAFAQREVTTNQAILGIQILDTAILDPRYLYRWLQSRQMVFQNEAQGIAQKNLSAGYVRSLEIPLPPREEQKRIATILDQADDIRRKRQHAIDRLSQLGQAIFHDMFEGAESSEWPMLELAEAVKSGTIVTYGIVQAGDEYPGGVPYIRTGDIKDGEIAIEGLRHTSPEIASKFERSKVHEGEIVMSIRATVGTVAFVPSELDGANLTQGTARISPGDRTDPDYLIEYLKSPPVQSWIAKQVKGATFREITLSRLRELPVRIPPMDLQCRFSAIMKQIKDQSLALSRAYDRGHMAFNSLRHRAFTGQL